MKKPPRTDAPQPLFHDHPRSFEANRYVYPVLSRRSGGISIGVNLNRDRRCNFNCIYCQVDRAGPCRQEPIDLDRLGDELHQTIEAVTSGRIFRETKFRDAPEPLRRLCDVALSGDGEPTLCPDFEAVVRTCQSVHRRRELDEVKLVLITNASTFHREPVRRALEVLDGAGGRIWAKLDAGTEPYFRQVARTHVSFRRILDNLREAAIARPIVIQSLFARIRGEPPPPDEQEAYGARLEEILAGGGRIELVQVHTVARPPAESWVAALSPEEVDALAELIRRRTGLTVESFYGQA
ncbi:MAG: radical SAM protein [Pirellulales bacterium]|nr:radical SAM protein [Pirellulales bacterium]